jgi:uncharacterized protein
MRAMIWCLFSFSIVATAASGETSFTFGNDDGTQSSDDAPSFDCKANNAPDELTICDDSELARLDRELAELYRSLQSNIASANLRKLRHAQRDWLKSRIDCGPNKACLLATYKERLRALKATQQQVRTHADPVDSNVPAPQTGRSYNEGSPSTSTAPQLPSLTNSECVRDAAGLTQFCQIFGNGTELKCHDDNLHSTIATHLFTSVGAVAFCFHDCSVSSNCTFDSVTITNYARWHDIYDYELAESDGSKYSATSSVSAKTGTREITCDLMQRKRRTSGEIVYDAYLDCRDWQAPR